MKSITKYVETYPSESLITLALLIFSILTIGARFKLANHLTISFLIILILLQITRIYADKYIKDKIYFFTIFVLIASPLSIYIIVLLIGYFKPSLIQVGDASDWIGFAGSIIGGSMTMFALIFTIQNEDTKRKSEELLRIMPFIKIEPILINQEIIDLTKPIIIRNVSNYPLRYLSLEKVYLEVNQDYPEAVNFNINDLPVFLPGGETYTPTFSQDLMDYLHKIKEGQIYLRLTFEYFDQLKLKKYEHTMILELEYYSDAVIFSEIKNVFTPE